MDEIIFVPVTQKQAHLLMAVLKAAFEYSKPIAESEDDPIVYGIANLFNTVAQEVKYPERIPVSESMIL